MKIKKFLVNSLAIVLILGSVGVISGCERYGSNIDETVEISELETKLKEVYALALQSDSDIGTYEEWLESIKGSKGDTGDSAYEMWIKAGNTGSKQDFLSSFDGREVEFRKGTTHIEWHYKGDDEWTKLVALSEIKGDHGDEGDTGDSAYETWLDVGNSGTEQEFLNSLDGREVEFRKSLTHIEWHYKGDDEWTKLVALSEIKGDQGDKGDTTLVGGQGLTDDLSNVYDDVLTSVVTVFAYSSNSISSGSGVFFKEDSAASGYAYIFTNAHVVAGATTIEVVLSNSIRVSATIVGYDVTEDVAVIKISKRQDYSVAEIRENADLKVGENVLTIGSPLGLDYANTMTKGVISGLNVKMSSSNSNVYLYMIQIDAAMNHGNSGGPLFDSNGKLIGINSMKLIHDSNSGDDVESFNFAIPASHFYQVASVLLNNQTYKRGLIGVTVSDIRYIKLSERITKNITYDKGLLVSEVSASGAAYGIINVNECIIAVEGIDINNSNDFSAILLNYSKDDKVKLTVLNQQKVSRNVEVILK